MKVKQWQLQSQVIKLACLAVHVEEMLTARGHEFDRTAVQALLRDPDIRALLDNPEYQVYLPLKRSTK